MKHVRPSMALMRSICNHGGDDTDIALGIYCSPNILLREFFWLRLRYLTRLINRLATHRRTALDFGGGSGVFLLTLATGFDSVRLIDQHTGQAEQMLDALALNNVELVSTNNPHFDFDDGEFDAVIAADVLEHFADLDLPLRKIHRWLGNDGLLFTSLPTENLAYRALRVIFRKQKPPDHYHSAAEVEDALQATGFRKAFGICHLLVLPILRSSASQPGVSCHTPSTTRWRRASTKKLPDSTTRS